MSLVWAAAISKPRRPAPREPQTIHRRWERLAGPGSRVNEAERLFLECGVRSGDLLSSHFPRRRRKPLGVDDLSQGAEPATGNFPPPHRPIRTDLKCPCFDVGGMEHHRRVDVAKRPIGPHRHTRRGQQEPSRLGGGSRFRLFHPTADGGQQRLQCPQIALAPVDRAPLFQCWNNFGYRLTQDRPPLCNTCWRRSASNTGDSTLALWQIMPVSARGCSTGL